MKVKLSKTKLFKQIEEKETLDNSSDKNDLISLVYKKITDYSLTTNNIKKKELELFQSFKINVTAQEPDLEEVISSLTNQLSIATYIQNKQQQALLTNNIIIKSKYSKKLENQAKEKLYINDYNIIYLNNFPYFFIDQYNKIVRYAISADNKTLQIIESFNKFIKYKINEYNKQLEDVSSGDDSEKDGIDKERRESDNQLDLDKNSLKILHLLEALILINALNYVIQHKQEAVFIDIFERNEDGTIVTELHKASKIILPKTHIIILCKERTITNEEAFNFLIIEPSDSKFNKHLGMSAVDYVISNLRIDNVIKTELSSSPYKIYQQKEEIDTEYVFDKFKDRIDIAFKLAAKLNTKDINFSNTEELSLIFANPLTNITVGQVFNNINDSSLEKSLYAVDFFDYPITAKQLTNLTLRDELYHNQIDFYKSLFAKIDEIENISIGNIVNDMAFQLLNAKTLDIQSLDNFIKKINLTLLKQDEIKVLWGIPQIITIDDMNFSELSGNFSKHFEDLYN